LRSDDAGLVTIALEPNTVYVQLWPTVFSRRAPNAIERVEAELGHEIRYGQRISTISGGLLAALTDAYREATGG